MENPHTSPASLRHLLVATDEAQGARDNDFCFATVGELVRFGSECDGEPIDGPCGCHRALSGMESLKGTTTFKVAALPISVPEFVDALQKSYELSGFGAFLDRNDAVAEATQLLQVADSFPVGTVLERRGNAIQAR